MTEPETTPKLPSNIEVWEGSSAYVDQGKHWSSALIWLCAVLLGGSLLWAFLAKLDQTITVRGRLEPSGSVRQVDSPSAGVVSKVFVRDGEVIRAGAPLFAVEARGLASRRQAIITTLTLLDLQGRALQGVLASGGDPKRFTPLPPLPLVQDPVLVAQLLTARQQTQQLRSRLDQLQTRLVSRKETLALQVRLAADLKPLFEQGGMARSQYLTQLNQVQESRSEVATLEEERTRVIAEAAGQLDQINRQLISLKSELVGLRETISYRTIRAPIDGKVFDVKLSPYSVINAGQVALKLVPANRLQAKVEISDADIGFVKVGLPVNVSVDSFPAGEFGYIKGTLTAIGSDALAPDQKSPQYRFPATITLQQQIAEAGGQPLNLQSGMSVSANVKLRSRPVISIVSDMFTKQLEGVKRFR